MTSEELKEAGNKCFQNKEFKSALEWYEKALALSPSNAALCSNISATHFCLKSYSEALKAADSCITIDPSWEKGYYRKGKALFELGNFLESYMTYEKGLSIAKSSKVLVDARNEALDAYHKLAKTAYYDKITTNMEVEVTFFGGARGKGLTAKRDFRAGEVIFTELPLVSHISVNEETNKFQFVCDHCMRTVLKEINLPPEWQRCYTSIYEKGLPQNFECKGKCGAKYCSAECQDISWNRYHSAMCTSTNSGAAGPLKHLVELCRKHGRTNPLVIARMFGTVVSEVKRGASVHKALEPFLVFVGGEWPSEGDEACFQFLQDIFSLNSDDQLKEVLNLAMYRNMNGIIQRNTSKIHPVSDFHAFVDNQVFKLPMTESKVNLGGKEVDLQALPEILGDDKISALCIEGTGLYTIANCANHDCTPNVMGASSSNSNRLSFIAKTNIKRGQECTRLLSNYSNSQCQET
eukprot:Phypoly_transcript_05648.p1 GENE.Phypoly_transcript_05648~~Phypoly_transcript_05648.p1  ORF type:complete len:464 (+),score=60.90 Phypoly_transcript_05648:158-1549(+)